MIKIDTDFQGWPVEAHTLREVLLELGFESVDGKLQISEEAPILKAYPRLLEDDGMGYGINPEYIVCADNETYEISINNEKVNVFSLFRVHINDKLDDEEIIPDGI